ncbi:MAG: YkvA family protein [Verrucomicrobiales bacterium]
MMDAFVEYLERHARKVTPAAITGFRQHLPELQMKVAHIHAPKLPHLVRQVDFLIQFVEDCADNAWPHYPYVTLAEAIYALAYLHRGVDIIPDFIEDIGYTDDSSLVRAVLSLSEDHFQKYAAAQNIEWSGVSLQP